MKVKYIGPEMVTLQKNKVYDVLQILHGTYQIMSELDEAYYFPPEMFEIIEE